MPKIIIIQKMVKQNQKNIMKKKLAFKHKIVTKAFQEKSI